MCISLLYGAEMLIRNNNLVAPAIQVRLSGRLSATRLPPHVGLRCVCSSLCHIRFETVCEVQQRLMLPAEALCLVG